ncbi:zinc ribbon domain-containing protein [Picosynechococcus sp. NKBG15041c]|uniref:zinc ribbon domain-containing protein n=1 Tax=Picosynechococcus sp. NKBG15041c TaxID=1407650 RepID=UPI000405E80C|nr:zinc ribbon domain-containing protein [Picosynechococcus sp. NKBG15041c]
MVTLQEHPLLPLATAIANLGYQPIALLWNATQRMAQVPSLAQDLLAYVQMGSPPPDFSQQQPAMLFKPLPGDYSVATLIRDFQFQAIGAFLMAVELSLRPKQGQALLNYFLHRGYWRTNADGSRDLLFPSLTERLPQCPQCRSRWFEDLPRCSSCGFVRRHVTVEDGPLPFDELAALLQTIPPDHKIAEAIAPNLPIPPGSVNRRCPQCHHPLSQNSRFCPNCGAVVTANAAPVDQTAACPKCGHPSRPGAKFCSHCGTNLV